MFDVVLQYFKSKTVWFGLLLAVASWLQVALVGAPLPPEILAVLGTVVGGAVVWLRSVTNTALSEK
jgi:hypothetical protein